MAFSKRILLAGDEVRLIQIVRQALEGTGKHLIEEERNYRTAFETARKFQPHIIFFDLGRCEVDWGEAIRQIKANVAFAGTPIFILTLSPNEDSVIYCGSLHGYEFSISPMKIEDLVSAVQTMVKV
jgi:CheY-like chemotaxis protein